MKTCIADNCENRIWSHQYCSRHQYLRTDDEYKGKAKEKINKKSAKYILNECFHGVIDFNEEAALSAMETYGKQKYKEGYVDGSNFAHHLLLETLLKEFDLAIKDYGLLSYPEIVEIFKRYGLKDQKK